MQNSNLGLEQPSRLPLCYHAPCVLSGIQFWQEAQSVAQPEKKWWQPKKPSHTCALETFPLPSPPQGWAGHRVGGQEGEEEPAGVWGVRSAGESAPHRQRNLRQLSSPASGTGICKNFKPDQPKNVKPHQIIQHWVYQLLLAIPTYQVTADQNVQMHEVWKDLKDFWPNFDYSTLVYENVTQRPPCGNTAHFGDVIITSLLIIL
jgi:hypothetical protein